MSTTDGGAPRLDPSTWFGKSYGRRVDKHQDLVILVSDWHNRRGTGKTVLSLKIAAAMDRTDDGLTADKCSLTPEELSEAYIDQPPGSALVLDEAEAGLSKYAQGSAANRAVRRLVSMGRIEEKYVVLNLPASAELDTDLKALCDIWALVKNRGTALVYSLGYNPFGGHPIPKRRQRLRWTDLGDGPLRDVYDELTAEKRARLRGEGDGGEGYIPRSEASEMAQRAEEAGATERRDELITEMYESGWTQKDIASLDSMPSRSRISQIINERAATAD